MSFKLVVKNGETKYNYDKKGNFSPKLVDLVEEYDTFSGALAEFLYHVNDDYTNNKVSLVYVPKNSKK